MSSTWYWLGGAAATALLLALAWWGWQRGGLAVDATGHVDLLSSIPEFLKGYFPMQMRWFAVPVLMAAFGGVAMAADCPPLLEGQLPKLRAKETIDLCQRFVGKPLVIVNTASFCGFAPQFKGLEALYQRYKDQGLEVIGVPSDDFKQEAKTGEETAKVCYVNYGVTFTMTEPQKVKGPDAVHLFKVLAQQSNAPKWNFYKYVVDRQGNVIADFSSLTKPDSPDLIEAVEQALASKP